MSVVLSEHLPLLSAAPGGIHKLRGLILELAVRGKLVPQDPNDEPASELLKRIAQERARLEAIGVCKKNKHIPVPLGNADPSELPAGWVLTNLASIALINPRNTADDSVEVSFIPMAMIGNRFEGSHQQETRKWGEVKQGFTHFAEGDIGVAKITPCFENSKACVFAGLKNGIGAGTTELHIVRPLTQTIVPRYLLAYLKAPMFLAVGETKMTGTAGQKRLPKDFLESNPFPLPPVAEQQRIVAKVDELMTLCDRLEAQRADAETVHLKLVGTLLSTLTQSTGASDFATNWQRLAEHFDTLFTNESSVDFLKQIILQLAVTGKLLGRDTQPWATQRLDKICSEVVDCPHSTPEWALSGKICVRTNQFRPGRLDLSLNRFVSEATFNERISRLKPEPEDILYSREGGILGVACRVPPDVEICLGQRMMLMRAGSEIDPAFLEIVLNSPVITELARQKTTGGAAPRVNVATVKAYPIPVPPLAEQRRTVTKVGELMANCDRLKADLAELHHRQERLASTLIDLALNAA